MSMAAVCQTLSSSLSARRAWIEITTSLHPSITRYVALRKESVDRNALSALGGTTMPESLSARRAWIEILNSRLGGAGGRVALRKESVDRN